jgi:REP element-mobilizing transposase RayT
MHQSNQPATRAIEERTMSHTYTSLLFHMVFSTKHRRPIIEAEWRARLHQYLGGTVRGLDSVALEIGGMADHVHLLVSMHQSYSVADFLRDLKANTSKWVNESALLRSRFEWQRGYGAFTVSKSQMEQVRRYIQNQEKHHRKMTFEEELIKLLDAHGIEYDPRYVFE